MLTHHLLCVVRYSRIVLVQNGEHWGHSEGQVLRLLEFLRLPSNVQRLEEGLHHTYEVSEIEWVTHASEMPSLSRSTGVDVLEIVSHAKTTREVPIPPISDAFRLANDQIFCEFAYVLDLDTRVLEIYRGMWLKTWGNMEPDYRFYNVGDSTSWVPAFNSSLTLAELQHMEPQELLHRLESDSVRHSSCCRTVLELSRFRQRSAVVHVLLIHGTHHSSKFVDLLHVCDNLSLVAWKILSPGGETSRAARRIAWLTSPPGRNPARYSLTYRLLDGRDIIPYGPRKRLNWSLYGHLTGAVELPARASIPY